MTADITIGGLPFIIDPGEHIAHRLKEVVERTGPGYLTDCSTEMSSLDGLSMSLKIMFPQERPQVVTYQPLGEEPRVYQSRDDWQPINPFRYSVVGVGAGGSKAKKKPKPFRRVTGRVRKQGEM
jgi:hypothetical protein